MACSSFDVHVEGCFSFLAIYYASSSSASLVVFNRCLFFCFFQKVCYLISSVCRVPFCSVFMKQSIEATARSTPFLPPRAKPMDRIIMMAAGCGRTWRRSYK